MSLWIRDRIFTTTKCQDGRWTPGPHSRWTNLFPHLAAWIDLLNQDVGITYIVLTNFPEVFWEPECSEVVCFTLSAMPGIFLNAQSVQINNRALHQYILKKKKKKKQLTKSKSNHLPSTITILTIKICTQNTILIRSQMHTELNHELRERKDFIRSSDGWKYETIPHKMTMEGSTELHPKLWITGYDLKILATDME